MAVTETERYELFKVLVEKLGAEGAQTLMEHLPPTGWSEVATKHDLDHLRALLRADLDRHRADTKADIAELRTEVKADIAELRTEVKADIAKLRTDVKADTAELRTEIQATELRLESKIERGLRLNAMTVIGVNASLLTAAVTAVSLLGR